MEQSLNIKRKQNVVDAPRLGSNQSGLRDHNERLVLSLIREAGALPKAVIARQSGLSAQTVSVIMRSLESDGLLKRGAPMRGKIGQPSIPMSLAPDGAFFFGLKVGRRSLDLLLTNFVGDAVDRVRLDHPYPTPDGTVRFATEGIARILDKLPGKHRARVAGLGIAIPFQLWDWAATFGVSAEEIKGWEDRDIVIEIGERCDFPVFVCNDASTACGAELVFGDRNKPRDFLYVFAGFFIGGGLVLDNALFTGNTGNAAALGSMMVQDRVGTLRQLVDVASLAVLESAVAAAGDRARMNWDDPESWAIPEPLLEAWLDDAASGIAQACLTSTCLLDVNHVLIDGWLPRSMRAALVRRIREYIAEIARPGIRPPEVVEGSVGPDARALGAASLPLSARFLIDRTVFQKGHSK